MLGDEVKNLKERVQQLLDDACGEDDVGSETVGVNEKVVTPSGNTEVLQVSGGVSITAHQVVFNYTKDD